MNNVLRVSAAVLVFVGFTAYTLDVAHTHGLLGFLTLAGRERWGMQLLLDLMISLFFAGAWVRHDARKRGIDARPYLVAMALGGSVGTFAYLVRRSLAPRPAPATDLSL